MKKSILFCFVLFTLTITSCTQNEANYSNGESQEQTQGQEEYKAIRIIRDDEDTGETQHQTEEEDMPNIDDSVDDLEQLAMAVGDLDKDKINEKVIVYDTDRNSDSDLGTEREIHIYKKRNGNWRLWHKSIGAVLPSEHGGMMGDPFQSLSIERGAIVFKHFGGSSFKWSYTHRFRYQNSRWELIGATIEDLAPCEYSKEFDWNLSTGKYIYTEQFETCDGNTPKVTGKNQKEARKKLSRKPKMDNFYPGNQEFTISNETTIYY